MKKKILFVAVLSGSVIFAQNQDKITELHQAIEQNNSPRIIETLKSAIVNLNAQGNTQFISLKQQIVDQLAKLSTETNAELLVPIAEQIKTKIANLSPAISGLVQTALINGIDKLLQLKGIVPITSAGPTLYGKDEQLIHPQPIAAGAETRIGAGPDVSYRKTHIPGAATGGIFRSTPTMPPSTSVSPEVSGY